MEILIVDDNVLDRKYLKYLIENHTGFSPVTAKDGEDALKKIKRREFDLIITDIVMPKIEGIELINQINHISPGTEIIAVSGENPYYLYIVKKLGIKRVFTKPIDANKFLACVRSIEKNRPRKVLAS